MTTPTPWLTTPEARNRGIFIFFVKKINEIIQEVTTLAKRKIQIIEKSWHYFSFFQVCFMYAKLYITLSSFLPSSPSCFPQNSMCSNGTKKCRLDLLNTVLKSTKNVSFEMIKCWLLLEQRIGYVEIWYCSFFVHTILNFPRFFLCWE